jgi:formylglycine-generating enzyme required for sulfatase activity
MKPVGSYPTGVSPYGCLDMIGNAFEWCSDEEDGHHILRGGAIGYPDRYNKTYAEAVEETGVT